MSADEMVINMVNKNYQKRVNRMKRLEVLALLSEFRMERRQRKAREKARKASARNAWLRRVLKVEAAILGAAAIFLFLAH